jgi:hypothetical protein
VRVPLAGTTSEPAFPILVFIIGLGTTEDSAIVGTVDGANGKERLDDVCGCPGSASW